MNKEKNTNYFYKLFKGEIKFSIVFWIWFVLISIIIELFLYLTFKDYQFDEKNYLQFFIYFLIFLYSIIIFYIVFKTANRYKGSKIWSFFAKIILSLNLFFSILFFVETYKFYFLEDYYIGKDIENFKENLPMQIDENSILIDIYKKEKTIFYKYILSDLILEEIKEKEFFKKQVISSLCENEATLELLKKDYILNYKYINEDKENLITIETKKEDCGDSIYDLDIITELLKKENSFN